MHHELLKPGPRFASYKDGKVPTQSKIWVAYIAHGQYMLDVPPVGIVVPVETAEHPAIGYFLEVDSLGLPAGTMLGMRWTPQDGNQVHRITHRLTGEETSNTRLRLEDTWILESEGKSVLIEHEMVLPDGTIQIADPITIKIPTRLVFGGMTVGNDQQQNDLFLPDEYPNGVVIHYEPIEHIQEWHTVRHIWSVLGHTEVGTVPLYNELFVLPGKPGASYDFLIPPEAYKGFEDLPFIRIVIFSVSEVRLAPEPNTYHYYGYGGITMEMIERGG